MFTRRRFHAPNFSGNWKIDGPALLAAITAFHDALETKDALYIANAQIHADEGVVFPSPQVSSSDANTLDDYAEGTWTPNDGSGAGLTLTVAKAKYTKVGRVVHSYFDLTYPATANGSAATISGLPFAVADRAVGAVINNGTGSPVVAQASSSSIQFFTAAGANVTNAQLSGAVVRVSISYMV